MTQSGLVSSVVDTNVLKLKLRRYQIWTQAGLFLVSFPVIIQLTIAECDDTVWAEYTSGSLRNFTTAFKDSIFQRNSKP